jgi:uncharacterized protein YcfJ
MNKYQKISVVLLCASASSLAGAAEFDEYARVVSSTPQVEQINTPRQECTTQYVQVQQPQQRSAGGAILGGIIGGVAGNQVGRGDGRAVATAAGAIAGAIIGDRVENNNSSGATVTEQPVRQCRTVDHWESRTTGYLVTYEYRGHTYTSNMSYDPGEKVKVHVSLTPR